MQLTTTKLKKDQDKERRARDQYLLLEMIYVRRNAVIEVMLEANTKNPNGIAGIQDMEVETHNLKERGNNPTTERTRSDTQRRRPNKLVTSHIQTTQPSRRTLTPN